MPDDSWLNCRSWNSSPEIGVFPYRQTAVKAGGQFQERSDAPLCPDLSLRGHQDPGDRFQQRAFSGAVLADNSEHVPLLQGKGYVFIGPESPDMVFSLELFDDILLDSDMFYIAGNKAQ